MAHDFYADLYKSENTIGMEEVLSHVPRKVSGEMNEALNADYTEEEVKVALFQGPVCSGWLRLAVLLILLFKKSCYVEKAAIVSIIVGISIFVPSGR
jgi:hypothetical protein